MRDVDSTDRDAVDYLLFGMAAIGELMGAAAVIVNSLPFAIIGGLVALSAIWGLQVRDARWFDECA